MIRGFNDYKMMSLFSPSFIAFLYFDDYNRIKKECPLLSLEIEQCSAKNSLAT